MTVSLACGVVSPVITPDFFPRMKAVSKHPGGRRSFFTLALIAGDSEIGTFHSNAGHRADLACVPEEDRLAEFIVEHLVAGGALV